MRKKPERREGREGERFRDQTEREEVKRSLGEEAGAVWKKMEAGKNQRAAEEPKASAAGAKEELPAPGRQTAAKQAAAD